MPTFCRHSRLIQNCPICAREQEVEMRPVLTPGTPGGAPPRGRSAAGAADAARTTGAAGTARRRAGGAAPARAAGGRGSGLRVRRLDRGADDGYASPLVPGLRSSEDAERLAVAIAAGAARLDRLATAPWDLYAEAADPSADLEERTWLIVQLAVLGTGAGADPLAPVRASRTSWRSGRDPDPPEPPGRRGGSAPGRTFPAYRAWAARAGTQAAAFTGDRAWSPQRRFSRVYERLALPGLEREPRYELLVLLGALGAYELSAGTLALGGDNVVTLAAKRALGIGDALLLERRAADLAAACEVPIAALDLALAAWERGEQGHEEQPPGAGSPPVSDAIRRALALPAPPPAGGANV